MSRYLSQVRFAECPRCHRRSTLPGLLLSHHKAKSNPTRWLKRHLRVVHGIVVPMPKKQKRRHR